MRKLNIFLIVVFAVFACVMCAGCVSEPVIDYPNAEALELAINAGVDVKAPEKRPVIIAVSSLVGTSIVILAIVIQPAQISAPEDIITRPKRIYVLKFFFKSPKNFGPAINPTEVTNNKSPRFSTTFKALVV